MNPAHHQVRRTLEALRVGIVTGLLASTSGLGAETGAVEPEAEASGPRPYLHWRVGEFDPVWGVLDQRGVSVGLDFNRPWSAELALDAWQLKYEPLTRGVSFGENQVITLIPQARFRLPVLWNRVAPYLLGGVGGGWVQFNDRTQEGVGHSIDIDNSMLAAAVGGGIDVYLADNVAFNVECKYVWTDPIGVPLDGIRRDWDASSFIATIGVRLFLGRGGARTMDTTGHPPRHGHVYLAAQGGFTALADDDWTEDAELVPKLNAPGNFLNLHYTLAVGADWGRHWSTELALTYTEYSLSLAGHGLVGEYSVYAAMPTVRYRLPRQDSRWVPYFLAGAGVNYGEFNDPKPRAQGLDVGGRGLGPAFHLGAGLDYFIAPNLALNIEARWRWAWAQPFRLAGQPDASGATSEFQLGAGFRVYFL